MVKPQGVWLRPTELGEVAEATVIAEGQHLVAAIPVIRQSAASVYEFSTPQKRHGIRPVLAVALGVCCFMLVGLVGLHVYAKAVSPLSQDLSVADSTVQPVSKGLLKDAPPVLALAQKSFGENVNDVLAMTEGLQELEVELNLPDEISLPLDMTAQQETVSALEENEEIEITIPTAVPSRALEEPPVIASRSGDSADAGEITVGDETFAYTRRLIVESTAYTWTGNKTATGTWPTMGTIAVDPLVIPLGSRVYVDGYGFAVAEDTGGLIKGNIIDVYFDTRDECILWGRKHGITIYLLE